MDGEDAAGPDLDMGFSAKREGSYDSMDLEGESDDSFEPDEEMEMNDLDQTVWLVKLPKFLMEKWATIERPGVVLGTLRVYHDPSGQTEPGKQKLVLRLPETTDADVYDISEVPRQYNLKMQSSKVENEYVMAQKPKDTDRNLISSRLVGKIVHDLTATPIMDQSYSQLVAARHRDANTAKRQIKQLDEDVGDLAMLAGSAGQSSNRFNNFVSTKPKPAAGAQFERAARMPENELMDLLFALFREAPHWSLKDVRTRTRQPEAYLREVLSTIAVLEKTGPNANTWRLNENFAREGVKLEGTPGGSAVDTEEVEQALGEDDDDDDEDDFDMEEVA